MRISLSSLLWFVVAIAFMAYSVILKRQCRALELRLRQSGLGSTSFDETRSPPQDSEDSEALRFLFSSDPPSTVSVEQAKSLTENDDDGLLYLDGLTTLTVEAVAIAEHKSMLSPDRLTTLTDAQAEALAKLKGMLSLDGLTTLTDKQAEALAKHKGDLHLNGLTSLTDKQAEAFAKHKGDWLSLDGLTTLTDKQAEALAKHKGCVLSLHGLTALSDEAAEKLRESSALLPDEFKRCLLKTRYDAITRANMRAIMLFILYAILLAVAVLQT